MHSRKFLLFNINGIWVKKGNPNVDVTIGSFDGAKVCELCRDDGLDFFENKSVPELEKIKNKKCKM